MECRWCKKSFKSETTLAVHMCVKKRRFADKDMSHIRLAHRAFQIFYEINTSATKPKTIEDFIVSQYYEAFVKYGRACTVIYLARWGEENNEPWQDYFVKVSPNRAVHDLRSAKISPWVVYLSESGDKLLERFNSEQVKMIQDVIEPPFWMKLFTANKEEVNEIKQACKEAKI